MEDRVISNQVNPLRYHDFFRVEVTPSSFSCSFSSLRLPFLHYWKSTSGFEVDFILGDHTAIEVKAKENVSNDDLKGLRALAEEKKLKRYLCVALLPRPRKIENMEILPLKDFLAGLWDQNRGSA